MDGYGDQPRREAGVIRLSYLYVPRSKLIGKKGDLLYWKQILLKVK